MVTFLAPPPVKISGLRKRYGTNEVIEGMDLELEAGRFYAILGKNGSGKSTLMRILAHRETACGGEACVLGAGLEDDFADRANRLAFVAEGMIYPPGISIRELFSLYQSGYPAWSAQAALNALAAYGLDPEKRVASLSRGQQVQMAVSLQLAYDPALILLDEVTSVLDAKARGILLRDLAARVQRGATVLLATNIVTEVQGIADSYVLLGGKRVKMSARAADLSRSFVKLTKAPENDHSVFHSELSGEVGLDGQGRLLFLLPSSDLTKFSGAEKFVSAEPVSASDVFIYLSSLRE